MRESGVGGHERTPESLGLRHIGRVIAGQVVTKFPAAPQQRTMGRALQRKVDKIIQGLFSSRREGCVPQQTPEHRGHLKVDEFRRCECVPPQYLTGSFAVRLVIGERHAETDSINDQHGPPASVP
jgi:hypothetical protein